MKLMLLLIIILCCLPFVKGDTVDSQMASWEKYVFTSWSVITASTAKVVIVTVPDLLIGRETWLEGSDSSLTAQGGGGEH